MVVCKAVEAFGLTLTSGAKLVGGSWYLYFRLLNIENVSGA